MSSVFSISQGPGNKSYPSTAPSEAKWQALSVNGTGRIEVSAYSGTSVAISIEQLRLNPPGTASYEDRQSQHAGMDADDARHLAALLLAAADWMEGK